MKQTIFETRQKADELLEEAINIWRQSDQNDSLEGLEKDPVMSLLIMAQAYLSNESVGDVEEMKTQLLQEFAQLLTPYEIGHAVPATAVVETQPEQNIGEIEMNEDSVFFLGNTPYTFIPLLRSTVRNVQVSEVVRMDGRRWKVRLVFGMPIRDLSGLTFAINSCEFRDLKVSMKNRPLPLVRPWDYSELPLVNSFGVDATLYNRTQIYNASSICFDLFARQNVRFYCIKEMDTKVFFPDETEQVDLVFEFTGITDKFLFDKSFLNLNTIVLVNAQLNTATLSPEHPIARVAGADAASNNASQQFLHVVRPSSEQLYGESVIDVRRVAGDRFNEASLMKLLSTLIGRYHTDYYAFQNLKGLLGDKMMYMLDDILSQLVKAVQRDDASSMPGVYLMLRRNHNIPADTGSLDVNYLTTAGASVNDALNIDATFSAPTGLNTSVTRQIAMPVYGSNEVRGESAELSLSRYYIATNDRIVTPADIKVFLYNELMTRYGITRSMVKDLSVGRRLQSDLQGVGYEIVVEITLAGSLFVKRNFVNKISQVEVLLEKMIEVRSANIYPISLSIKVVDN